MKNNIRVSLSVITILSLVCFIIISLPHYYTEDEITPTLCQAILEKSDRDARSFCIIDIQKLNNTIVAGYTWGDPAQTKTFGYLSFARKKNKYTLYHNYSNIGTDGYNIYWTIYLDASPFCEDYSEELPEYILLFNMDENLRTVIVSDDHMTQKIDIKPTLSMYLFKHPSNGGSLNCFDKENNIIY